MSIFIVLGMYLALSCSILHAEESVFEPHTSAVTYESLCNAYMQKDTALQTLAVKTQQAVLAYQKAAVQNGIALSVSSGAVSAEFDDKVTVTAAPQASLNIPAANSTTVTASVPVTVTSAGGSRETYVGTTTTGAGVSVKTGIVTSARADRNTALQKADRIVVEAQRAEEAGRLESKKAFAACVSQLCSYVSAIIKARDDQFEYETAFRTVKVQGYLPTSAKYRAADLKARTAQRASQEALRSFNREYTLFMEKCGISSSRAAQTMDDVFAMMPADIPDAELVVFDSFDETLFVQIEACQWAHYINTLTRDSVQPFSLFGNAGWSYAELSRTGEEQECHSITAGLDTSYKGVAVSGGVSVPVTGGGAPSVTVSIGWAPSTNTIYDIDKTTGTMDSQIEMLSLYDAQETYRTTQISRNQKREDLLWSKSQYEEESAVYQKLLHDAETGYESGAVTNADYLQAQNDSYQSYITERIGRLDRIIYNLETSLLFVSNGEHQ